MSTHSGRSSWKRCFDGVCVCVCLNLNVCVCSGREKVSQTKGLVRMMAASTFSVAGGLHPLTVTICS